MPRVTNAQAQLRREKVARLWARGRSLRRIARELEIDFATARRDVALVAKRVAADLDVPRELRRLLRGCQEVEADAWDAGHLGLVLATQRQQLAVLQVMQGIDLEQRLAEVEARLDAVQGVTPWASPHLRAEARRN